MKPKVYIETTVVSYQTGRFSRDMVVAGHQQSTRAFWELLGSTLDPFVSALVVKEAAGGDSAVAKKRLAAWLLIRTQGACPVFGAPRR